MGTKSREVIWGGQIMGEEIHAKQAREEGKKAICEADRAEALAWSVRMEGYGGPSQPSPTIGQCINGGMEWLEVECNRGFFHDRPSRHFVEHADTSSEMPAYANLTP